MQQGIDLLSICFSPKLDYQMNIKNSFFNRPRCVKLCKIGEKMNKIEREREKVCFSYV